MSLTIAVAGYNYGPFVAQALDSVLSQTVPPDDVIYVDDCSKDNSVEIAKAMGVRTVARKKNLGIVDNFNDILFKQVSTEHLIVMGADNWAHPELVFEMQKYADHDIVTYDLFIVGSEAKGYRDIGNPEKCRFENGYWVRRFKSYKDINARLMRSNVCHGSSMYDVELARKVGGYRHHPRKKRPEEDFWLWKQMAKSKARIVSAERPLLYYRRHKLNHLGVY